MEGGRSSIEEEKARKREDSKIKRKSGEEMS